jgi:hypothetical protein
MFDAFLNSSTSDDLNSRFRSSRQARAERVAARLRQDRVVPRLHEEHRYVRLLGETCGCQGDVAADHAADGNDTLLLGQPPEAVDGRRPGLVVSDREIEHAPLPSPFDAA